MPPYKPNIHLAYSAGLSQRYKRPFDVCVLAIALVALAPVWIVLSLAIALAIRCDDGGRILHRQWREGRGGREFEIIKFRTMVEHAETGTGPVWAAVRDGRITRVGALLRRYHLDEIPQIVNVLRGEMSLVGPRPERPALVRRIERRLPRFRERLRVRPGIAGLAQARGEYHSAAQVKLRYDQLYIATMGPLLDLKLLVVCLVKALRPAGPAPSAPSAARARRRAVHRPRREHGPREGAHEGRASARRLPANWPML